METTKGMKKKKKNCDEKDTCTWGRWKVSRRRKRTRQAALKHDACDQADRCEENARP